MCCGIARVMGVCMMGRSMLILALYAVFCRRALCTSEVCGDMCQDNPVMRQPFEHAELLFFRCDGDSVNTTIEVERFTQDELDLVIDVTVNGSTIMPYDCRGSNSKNITDNGDILGYVDFSEDCNKSLIVFNPPPTLRTVITIYVNMNQTSYGPYYIGQEGIMFQSQNMSESCGGNLTLYLTNLTRCNPGMPPYNVNVTYGKNTWTLWRNGTSTSTLEPECISHHSLTCQANGTMAELRLYLNASVEGCQNLTLSTVVAKYDRAIQRQTSIKACTMPEDQNTPNNCSKKPDMPEDQNIATGTIIGIVIGVVVSLVIIFLVIVFICICCCRKKEEAPNIGVADPPGNPLAYKEPASNGPGSENVQSKPETGEVGGQRLDAPMRPLGSSQQSTMRDVEPSNGGERCGTDKTSGDQNEPAEVPNADTEGL